MLFDLALFINLSNFQKKLNEKEEADGDVEVSWVDQQRINEFSKYNAKIDDLEEQYEKLKVKKKRKMLNCCQSWNVSNS